MTLVSFNDSQAARQRAKEHRMLARLGELCVEELKTAIDKTDLNNKEGIKRSIKWKLLPGKVLIQSDHPAFYLDQGVRPHQMRYVRNKLVPFDPKTLKQVNPSERHKGVAFRRLGLTPQHPGYEALNFVEEAMAKAQDRLAIEMLDKFIMGN